MRLWGALISHISTDSLLFPTCTSTSYECTECVIGRPGSRKIEHAIYAPTAESAEQLEPSERLNMSVHFLGTEVASLVEKDPPTCRFFFSLSARISQGRYWCPSNIILWNSISFIWAPSISQVSFSSPPFPLLTFCRFPCRPMGVSLRAISQEEINGLRCDQEPHL